MNQAVYQSYLTPQFQSHLPKTLAEGAEAMATAYHLANIGQTTTPFGAPLINADKTILKTFIELSLNINFYGGQLQSILSSIIGTIRGVVRTIQEGGSVDLSVALSGVNGVIDSVISVIPAPLSFLGSIIKNLIKEIFEDLSKSLTGETNTQPKDALKCIKKLGGIVDLLDVSKIAYLVMATGYCLYWLTANMSPVPPMPPCIGPTTGTIILIPGLPLPLNSDLSKTFKNGNTVLQAVGKLYNSLIQHQLMIIGVYLGIIPFVPSPIPGPPIPWFSMLNIPFPDFKLPALLGGEKTDQEKEQEDEQITPGDKLGNAVKRMRDQSDNTQPC